MRGFQRSLQGAAYAHERIRTARQLGLLQVGDINADQRKTGQPVPTDLTLGQRVSCAHQNRGGRAHQLLHPKVRWVVRLSDVDCKIQTTGRQRLKLMLKARDRAYGEPRRQPMQPLDKFREQRDTHVLGEGHGDFARVGVGVKARTRNQSVDIVQYAAQFCRQLQRARCGLHAALAAREQGVAKQAAQATQGFAHGRLCNVQPFRGPRYTAFLEQCVQGHQQIQVGFVQIKGVHRSIMNHFHDKHKKNTLDIY